ncbi:LysM domain-containing protein [Methylovirgula ligni]|uniref:LysM domain-containing protein n=1 Tax=Methylovirgula ligni TaxID=569860 RepID=A0A3D9YZ73_9HYPH|nr:LysM peptidoglycan-binding domain-containing protein [Methylovirgula ligni]REF88063.1 LysM domain-containing protein [Methylovirgula ligni]
MKRSQFVALLLGAAVVAVGAALAWRAHLLQTPVSQPLPIAGIVPPSGHAPEAATLTVPPAQVEPAKPQQQIDEAAIPPEGPVARPAAALEPAPPQFDTVRVEPSGDAVVAGHGQPNDQVALLLNGKAIANIDADGAGNFVIVPTPLAPGNYELTLEAQRPGEPLRLSRQVVTVSVPAKGQKNLVVAVAEPGKPSAVLADTAAPPEAKPANATGVTPVPSVSFKTTEVDRDGFYATGAATPPGERVRIYLNGAPLTAVTAAKDGHWSLTVKKGLAPGRYVARADALDTGEKVIARAEVNFDVPVLAPVSTPSAAAAAPAAAQAPVQQAPVQEMASNAVTPPAAASVNDAIVPRVDTATVARGDSLWRISRKLLGHGMRYTSIYEANASQIRDPDLIYPGQVFVMPKTQ